MYSKHYFSRIIITIFIMCLLLISNNKTTVLAANQVPIIGETEATKGQIIQYYEKNSPVTYPYEYVAQGLELEKFVDIVILEAKAEGVRADIAFAQIILETNWFTFSQQADITKNNFGGLKDENGNYLSFQSIEEGIRANIQLLKGDASTESLNQEKIKQHLEQMVNTQIGVATEEQLEKNDSLEESNATSLFNTEIIKMEDNPSPEAIKQIEDVSTQKQISQNIPTNVAEQNITMNSVSQVIEAQPAEVKTLTIDGTGYAGVSHRIRSYGTSENGVLYQFWVKDLSENKWMMIQDYSKSSAQWIPTKPGKYLYGVHIKDEMSSERLDAHSYKEIIIKEIPVEVKTLTIDGTGYVGSNHRIRSYGTSPNGVLYQFWIKDLSTNKWTMIQDYSKSSAAWIPAKPGKYLYGVHIKDEKSQEKLDAHLYKEITIKEIPTEVISLAIEGTGYVKEQHIIRSSGTSRNGVLYQFWIKDLSENRWIMIQDYGSKSNTIWMPEKPGDYLYGVHIKDEKSTNRLDAHIYKEITVKEIPTEVTSLAIDGTGYVGEQHVIKSSGTSRNGVLYQFWIKDLSENKWTMIQDYGSKNSAIWTPTKPGNYLYGIHIKDEKSTEGLDAHLYKEVTVRSPITYVYTNYNQTLMENINIQMTINPQTDLYGGGWKTATWEDTAQKINPNNCIDTNLILVSNSSAEVMGVGKITASPQLNVRNQPTTNNSTIIATVDEGKEYTITGQSNGWYKITTETGVTGWISGAYVEVSYTNLSKLTTLEIKKALYVRSEPTTATNNNFALARVGEKYTIQGQRNGWYKIKVGDRFGWIEISDNRGLCISILSNPVTSVSYPLHTTANQISTEMYQFLVLSGSSGISVDDLSKELVGKGILQGKAQAFIDAGKRYNINEVYLLSHALLETGNGKSSLANGILVTSVDGQPVTPKVVYNMYGIGAVDSNPIGGGTEYAYKAGWFSPEEAIIGGAKFIGQGYINEGQDTLYKMKWNPLNPGTHQYATDIGWATKQTKNIGMVMDICERYGSTKLIFDIPVYR
ncbi:beta-N-acetylglucosaminidase [Alkalibaculum bacchi]|uniref:Beta-N-acetylglucosaminidase n=1 Tax=Alkalibaculum bacchi TaxID=645887 RepID=A0A366IE82_9FIRM|nr:glucosaminidase domain-containing protein [Alkalibaculum bacchi]RBP69079.1 beta-N-acetylglucosaminidase [Alkalibaculum bacchi]